MKVCMMGISVNFENSEFESTKPSLLVPPYLNFSHRLLLYRILNYCGEISSSNTPPF